MITVYKIVNNVNDKVYFGITKTALNLRWNNHKYWSKKKNTPLYAAIRKYGLDSFSIVPIVYCDSWSYACEVEKKLISTHDNLYNLASGGEGGFNITDIPTWKEKLSKARQGRKPFQGGKHSEETKEKCKQAALNYWSQVKSNELG